MGKGTWDKNHRYFRSVSDFMRNPLWLRIVAKAGFKAEICLRFTSEEECFAEEKRLISFHGCRFDKSGKLCNMTEGGEGQSGRVGRLSGRYGTKHSEETRQKMSQIKYGKYRGALSPHFGKKRPPEVGRRVSEARKKALLDPELRRRLFENLPRGTAHPYFGKPRSAETRAKLSAAHKARRALGLWVPARGYKWSEEARSRVSKLRKGKRVGKDNVRSVRVINALTGEIHESQRAAAKAFGVDNRLLNLYMRGKRKNKTPLRYLEEYEAQLAKEAALN